MSDKVWVRPGPNEKEAIQHWPEEVRHVSQNADSLCLDVMAKRVMLSHGRGFTLPLLYHTVNQIRWTPLRVNFCFGGEVGRFCVDMIIALWGEVLGEGGSSSVWGEASPAFLHFPGHFCVHVVFKVQTGGELRWRPLSGIHCRWWPPWDLHPHPPWVNPATNNVYNSEVMVVTWINYLPLSSIVSNLGICFLPVEIRALDCACRYCYFIRHSVWRREITVSCRVTGAWPALNNRGFLFIVEMDVACIIIINVHWTLK
jgi:hypothetical protein